MLLACCTAAAYTAHCSIMLDVNGCDCTWTEQWCSSNELGGEQAEGGSKGVVRWYKRQMKKQAGRMLAIGDGANDVAMIQVGADGSAQAACALPAQSYMA